MSTRVCSSTVNYITTQLTSGINKYYWRTKSGTKCGWVCVSSAGDRVRVHRSHCMQPYRGPARISTHLNIVGANSFLSVACEAQARACWLPWPPTMTSTMRMHSLLPPRLHRLSPPPLLGKKPGIWCICCAEAGKAAGRHNGTQLNTRRTMPLPSTCRASPPSSSSSAKLFLGGLSWGTDEGTPRLSH